MKFLHCEEINLHVKFTLVHSRTIELLNLLNLSLKFDQGSKENR